MSALCPQTLYKVRAKTRFLGLGGGCRRLGKLLGRRKGRLFNGTAPDRCIALAGGNCDFAAKTRCGSVQPRTVASAQDLA